jgi:molecular chaperone HtpG
MLGHLTEFDGKPIVSVAKGELDLGRLEDEAEKKAQESSAEEFKALIEQVRESLGEDVKDVRITYRLTDSPACLVVESYDLSINLERLLKAAGQKVPGVKPILELNPTHPLVQRLKSEDDETQFGELSRLLFEQSMLAEGGKLEDPASFVKRVNEMILKFAAR